jgi:hypothetical protein
MFKRMTMIEDLMRNQQNGGNTVVAVFNAFLAGILMDVSFATGIRGHDSIRVSLLYVS